MALPKHNALLRWLYIVSIIGMFIFMSWVIRGYWDETALENTKNHEVAHQALNYPEEGSLASPEIDKRINAPGMVLRPEIVLATMQFQLQLNEPIEAQISVFWASLFDHLDLVNAAEVVDNKKVYQVYRHYDLNKNTVDILLGFEISEIMAGTHYQVVKLAAASMLPRKSVLESWQNYEHLPITLSYEQDYEIFQLDKHYKTVSQKAFLNAQ